MSKGSARSGILIEGLMIVVSILLAFVIQAWWEGRDIRADRVAALVSLRQDFEGYTALIDSRRVRNEDAVAAASEVLSWTGPDAQPVDELGSALVRLMGFAPLDLSPGSVANLVGSDGRKLIENLELQDALIEWAQALERLARRNEFVAAEAEKLNLYITDRYPFRSFYEGRFLSDSRFPARGETLLRDPTFENLVFMKGTASDLILTDVEILERLSGVILGLLGEELAGMGIEN